MSAGGNPLRGRVAVVTGAARGLGAELARRLTDRGAAVALLGLEPRELDSVAQECGPDAASWEVDVTDAAAVLDVATAVLDRFGRVDVVVANAGIGAAGPVLLADPDTFDRVIEVNLLGSVRTARAFLPHLIASRGYLLQIASLAAIAPIPTASAYCASKAGVEAFAQALGAEVAPHGVGVGVAYLSWTDTDLVRGMDAWPGLRDARIRLPYPLNRTYPVGPSVARLVAGIERRSPRVYGRPWLRPLPWLRGAIPPIVAATAGDRASEAENHLRRNGTASSLPIGPGGAADAQARRRRAARAVP
jgi:NAD(P)-dependent dehydrogenase (short-subunit alcohol dehydrogenase family)